MKRAFVLLAAAMLFFTGCSGKTGGNAIETGDISINNEKLLKEFSGTVNISGRYDDTIMLSAEEGEDFRNYIIDIDSGQVSESDSEGTDDRYIYYEPMGDKGSLLVEGEEYRSILKYKDSSGTVRTIADDIGFSEAMNISVSPKGNRVAYTALQEGAEELGIYIYDTSSSVSRRLRDIKDEELEDDFNYLVNWSPDENYVIIQNRYIYDAGSGFLKGELKSVFSRWSPSGSKVAFVLQEDAGGLLQKKVCIYDVSKGSYVEVFTVPEDEYVFGGIAWSGNESKLAFTGVKVGDKNSPDWYMQLNYSSLYVVDVGEKKAKVLETNVDAGDGSMIELSNLMFSREGALLCYTVGNYENCTLHVVNTESLEGKSFENAEYLHWIDNENYGITAGRNSLYFCVGNKILRIDEKLKETVKYTSKIKLDDFYLDRGETGILLFEQQEEEYVARYIGK